MEIENLDNYERGENSVCWANPNSLARFESHNKFGWMPCILNDARDSEQETQRVKADQAKTRWQVTHYKPSENAI